MVMMLRCKNHELWFVVTANIKEVRLTMLCWSWGVCCVSHTKCSMFIIAFTKEIVAFDYVKKNAQITIYVSIMIYLVNKGLLKNPKPLNFLHVVSSLQLFLPWWMLNCLGFFSQHKVIQLLCKHNFHSSKLSDTIVKLFIDSKSFIATKKSL